MKTIRKINDELAIAGQVTSEQLQQIAQEEFKSVLNLRSPDEDGFLSSEQEQAQALGLSYMNIPIKLETINDEIGTRVFRAMNELPKPILIHCSSAKRAAALVLMYIATRQGATLQQAFQQAEQLGLFGVLTYQR
jgi:uncharacterized protein (TIGR01244 family)